MKEVILGDKTEQEKMTFLVRLKRWIVYVFFIITLSLSYTSTKKLYIVSKRYTQLVSEYNLLANSPEELKECKTTLGSVARTLNSCINDTRRVCHTAVYINDECKIIEYGNFAATKK